MYCGAKESDINLDIAKTASVLLQGRGIFTHLTRTGDSFVSLAERVRIAEEWGVKYFISIHCNAAASPRASGIETWQYANSMRGACLAHEVHNRVVAITNARDRGVRKTDILYVLKRTSMPSILLECGFLSNLVERELLREETYRQSIAGAIAEGVDKYIRRGTS